MAFTRKTETAELTRQIVQALKGVNDEISDQTLLLAVGEKVSPRDAAMINALRDLQKADPPICFNRVRKYGYKRLHDPDLVADSETGLKRISRSARRCRQKLDKIVHFASLPHQDQLQAARNNTRLNAIEETASSVKVRTTSAIPDLSAVIQKIKETSL